MNFSVVLNDDFVVQLQSGTLFFWGQNSLLRVSKRQNFVILLISLTLYSALTPLNLFY